MPPSSWPRTPSRPASSPAPGCAPPLALTSMHSLRPGPPSTPRTSPPSPRTLNASRDPDARQTCVREHDDSEAMTTNRTRTRPLRRIQRLSGRARVRLVVIASLSSCSRTHVCRASGSLEAFNVLGEGGDVRGVEGGPGLSECIEVSASGGAHPGAGLDAGLEGVLGHELGGMADVCGRQPGTGRDKSVDVDVDGGLLACGAVPQSGARLGVGRADRDDVVEPAVT